MTAISKNVYFDVLEDIVNKYNNTVQLKWNLLMLKIIHMVNTMKILINKDPTFKVGDNVRISKHKNIFAKAYTSNWLEDVFVFSKIKNTVPWTYVISDLNGEEITGRFYEEELLKLVKKNLE